MTQAVANSTILCMELPIVLLIFCCVLFVWNILLSLLIVKEKQVFQQLAKGVTKKDLVSLLKQILDSLKNASHKIEAAQAQIDVIHNESKYHLQKLGLVRFNPFANTGGDQSFSLCLLDETNSGIVITSLHSRETTRIYTKQIEPTSIRKEDFSEEEWQAYQEAVKINRVSNTH